MPVREHQLFDLLCQTLETEELGGVPVWEAALACARHQDVRQEWDLYLEETNHHAELVDDALRASGFEPNTDTSPPHDRHRGRAARTP